MGAAIAAEVGASRYNLWFRDTTRFELGEEQATVGVPNLFFQEWLQANFLATILRAVAKVTGRELPVRLVIDPELFQGLRTQQHGAPPALSPAEDADGLPSSPQPAASHNEPKHSTQPGALPRANPAGKPGETASRLGPEPTRQRARVSRLEDFVVGPANRLAHAAAMEVIENPGASFNPLYLHGPVGLGKTHLLEGIAAALRRRHSAARVYLLRAEEFTNQFLEAMRGHALATFRRRFRELDALLVDDIQFLANKRATQAEFLHTFNALLGEGRLVVVTADNDPRQIESLQPELATRFLAGMVCRVDQPDYETRLAILRARAARMRWRFGDDVLRYVAEHLRSNVRELEGALNTLAAASELGSRQVDLHVAREALAEFLRHAARSVRLKDIEEAVCRVFTIDPQALRSKNRGPAVSHPRMVAMYLARRQTQATCSTIGAFFGGRPHTTVISAEKKVAAWLECGATLQVGDDRRRATEVLAVLLRALER